MEVKIVLRLLARDLDAREPLDRATADLAWADDPKRETMIGLEWEPIHGPGDQVAFLPLPGAKEGLAVPRS
jgi:hypothetical protein